MTIIQQTRINAVEPIVRIVGRTEGGDWLIEDRNGKQFGIANSLIEEARADYLDDMHAAEAAAIADEMSVFPAASVVTGELQSEPAPKPKKKKSTKARKAK